MVECPTAVLYSAGRTRLRPIARVGRSRRTERAIPGWRLLTIRSFSWSLGYPCAPAYACESCRESCRPEQARLAVPDLSQHWRLYSSLDSLPAEISDIGSLDGLISLTAVIDVMRLVQSSQ
jgi:hypothetical protein